MNTSRLTVRPVSGRDMGRDLVDHWRALHDASGADLGPFLHPDYVRSVASVRDDVEVGVLSHAGEPVGFVPYQRALLGVGTPVGGRLCDLAGALVRPDIEWSAEELLSDLRLHALRLSHVPVDRHGFASHVVEQAEAPYLDLSDGFEAYRQANLDSGSRFMRQLDRRRRGAEREVGPIRFEWHTTETGVLEALMRWKTAQRNATRTPNVLELPWARALMDRLLATDRDDFAGVLSALWIGDHLAAAHFGMRTKQVLHYWIPAYNNDLAAYSPGLLALVSLAEECPGRGIERVNLGVGEERYKHRASNAVSRLATVAVTRGAVATSATRAYEEMREWTRSSPLGTVARKVARTVTRGAYNATGKLHRTLSIADPDDREEASGLPGRDGIPAGDEGERIEVGA